MDAPVFVKISKYKELTSVLNKIQERLDAASKTIEQIESIKQEEDQRVEEWKQQLETVREKLKNVDSALHTS